VIVIGLTGSIGMGKTTAARVLSSLGAPVCDSDAVVHRLTARGGAAVGAVSAAFPGVVENGAVDRRALGRQVFGDPISLARLEAILHPLVERAQERFVRLAARRRVRVAVLDIPLLFETGADRRVDTTIVVSAPVRVQRARVLARRGMTPAKLDGILARQMPDAEKRRRADRVIQTGLGRGFARRALTRLFRSLKTRPPRRRRSIWRFHA